MPVRREQAVEERRHPSLGSGRTPVHTIPPHVRAPEHDRMCTDPAGRAMRWDFAAARYETRID